jgi:peroxiredoxin
MNLSEDLIQGKKDQNKRYPFFVTSYFYKEIARIYEENYLERAFKVGDKIPESNFLNKDNEVVTLSDQRKGKPAILSFYRGSWCPFCNLELRNYNHLIEESEMDSINMFAISPEAPDSSINTDDLHFSTLSDVNNNFAKKLNLVYKPSGLLQLLYRFGGINLKKNQGNRDPELPIPATYVVDKDGVITFAFVDPDYTKRAEPSLVLEEYKKL